MPGRLLDSAVRTEQFGHSEQALLRGSLLAVAGSLLDRGQSYLPTLIARWSS